MKRLLLTTIALFTYQLYAQELTNVTFESDELISTKGLVFTNQAGVDFNHGPQISPHGDCIDIFNNYIYFSWYEGGLKDPSNDIDPYRQLRVSRKKIGESIWTTANLPGELRGAPNFPGRFVGDSHNSAAVGISPKDGRVHIIYDLHSYTQSNTDSQYFKYVQSDAGIAFADDSEFNSSSFEAERNYLNPNQTLNRTGSGAYENYTYPEFNRIGNGDLSIYYRYATAARGNTQIERYDTSWKERINLSNGLKGNDNLWYSNDICQTGADIAPLAGQLNWSFYPSFPAGTRFFNGKFYNVGMTRFRLQREDTGCPNFRFNNNNGLFVSIAANPTDPNGWTNISGGQIPTPISNPYDNGFYLGKEPCEVPNDRVVNSIFTVTENNDLHAIIPVSNGGTRLKHYYIPNGETAVQEALAPVSDRDLEMHPLANNKVLVVSLELGKPVLHLIDGGTNRWREIYRETSEINIFRYESRVYENKLYIVYMDNTGYTVNGTIVKDWEQPLRFLTYNLEFSNGNIIEIEAENHQSSSGQVQTTSFNGASGNSAVTSFDAGEWMEYTFDISKEGNYRLDLFASSITTGSNASLDVLLDNSLIINSLSTNQTYNSEVFEKTTSSLDIYLTAGSHTLRLQSEAPGNHIDRFRLSWVNSGENNPDADFTIEAEDTTAASGVIITNFSQASGGKAIDGFGGSDWMDYSITVQNTGYYILDIWASVRNIYDSNLKISVDGEVAISNAYLRRTGDWNIFRRNIIPEPIFLEEGNHIIRFNQNKSLSSKLDKFSLTFQDDVIEAEDYVDFNDFDIGNSGGDYRTAPGEDVDINSNANASNGHAVVQFKGGDWTEYTIQTQSSGNYQLDIWASVLTKDDSNVEISVDGEVAITNAALRKTGDWNIFQRNIIAQPIFLSAGEHTIRIKQNVSLSSNLDKFSLTLKDLGGVPILNIEAEDYTAFSEYDAINEGGTNYNADPVDIYASPEASNGFYVERIRGSSTDPDWTEYTLQVDLDGNYDLVLTAAAWKDASALNIQLYENGNPILNQDMSLIESAVDRFENNFVENRFPLQLPLRKGSNYILRITQVTSSSYSNSLDKLKISWAGIYSPATQAPQAREALAEVPLSLSTADDTSNILLYPNPASTSVTIRSQDGNPLNSVTIFNMIGMVIDSFSTNTSELQVDISGYQPGIYGVLVNNDSFILIKE